MRCKEIIDIIEESYPRQAACEWDNVGLLAGRYEKDVQKVFLALDATDDIIRQAIETGADMLITHHPLIFSPLKSVTDGHFISRRVVNLIQKDISYYAMHTNYDVMRMAELAADKMGLVDTRVMDVTCRISGETGQLEGRIEVAGDSPDTSGTVEKGIGVTGSLKKTMTLGECCEMVKAAFHLPAVKLFGDPDQKVERAATVPGSGKGQTPAALKSGAQLLITGDIDHHEGIDALSQGLSIIDAGHYGLEYIFMEDMKTFLNQACPALAVETAPVCHPFQMI